MSGRENRRVAVPKFSSFKPKTAPEDPPASTPVTSGAGDGERKPRERRHHREPRSPGNESLKSRRRSRSRSRSPRAAPGAEGRGAEQRPEREDAPPAAGLPLFVVDKKGDPLIRKFGIDKYKAPQFRREGREDVLGTDGYLYIHRDAADEQFSIRRRGQFYGSTRDKNPFKSRIRHVQAKRLRPSRDAASHGMDTDDFISLSTRQKRARRDEELSDEEDRPDYRSIERKKPRGALDSDVDTDSADSDDDGGVAERDPLKERSIELTRRVKERPNDIPAWVELIDHQDVLMKAGADIYEDLPVDEVKSFAEIKLSMYEKALSHTESFQDRERLLVGQMREGRRVWDENIMAARWSKLSGEIESSFALWRANLDFEMSSIKTFQYDRVKKIFFRRLALLGAKAVDFTSPWDLGSLYSEMIYVFLRATRFLQDCGYRELSVAAWQALLELNFCSGDGISAPQPAVPGNFEQFWESEAPRIGEEGAMGWDHFMRTGGPDAPEPVVAEKGEPVKSRDVYKAWAAEEVYREKQARMPSRTLDETNADDPYGIVMFSDLEGLLFVIPREVVAEAQGELLDAFLTFCHLPGLSSTRAWSTDPLVAPVDRAFSDTIEDTFSALSHPTLLEEDSDSSKPPPKFATSSISPAVAPDFICSLLHCGRYAADEDAPVALHWVSRTLKTLADRGYAELARYCLTLDWITSREGIKSPARELIRRYPENVELYNLYGLLEWENGDLEVAKKVLSSATRLGETSSGRTLSLWLSWAWIELVDGAPFSRVLSRLCFSTDEETSPEGPSPTTVLKHKQELTSLSAQCLLRGDLGGFSIAAKMVAMLEYLSSTGGSEPRSERQGSISSAMDVIWRHSGALQARDQGKSAQHEELLNFAAMLLYMHTNLG